MILVQWYLVYYLSLTVSIAILKQLAHFKNDYMLLVKKIDSSIDKGKVYYVALKTSAILEFLQNVLNVHFLVKQDMQIIVSLKENNHTLADFSEHLWLRAFHIERPKDIKLMLLQFFVLSDFIC